MNDYVGSFKCGFRDGDGQMYFHDGVYDGNWKKNKRSGHGIMCYNDGATYVGEWYDDKFHGHGVLVNGNILIYMQNNSLIYFLLSANGNRYEGAFSNGMKNGKGIYFHKNTGQVQLGIWVDDVCKTSMIQDGDTRTQLSLSPTPYPIPEVYVKLIKK